MHFELNKIYHVYNRGNNRQQIFFNKENYAFFLRKMNRLVLPHCDLLAYCLMPDHFHFLIHANEHTVSMDEKNRNRFSESVRKLLKQYSKVANRQERKTAALFQQQTKANEISEEEAALHCFIHIHKSPLYLKERDLSKWRYSSFPDYAGLREGSICNKELACSLLGISEDEFSLLMEAVLGDRSRNIIQKDHFERIGV